MGEPCVEPDDGDRALVSPGTGRGRGMGWPPARPRIRRRRLQLGVDGCRFLDAGRRQRLKAEAFHVGDDRAVIAHEPRVESDAGHGDLRDLDPDPTGRHVGPYALKSIDAYGNPPHPPPPCAHLRREGYHRAVDALGAPARRVASIPPVLGTPPI